MAARKPLVLVSGLFSELPVGDITVELAAAPSGLIYVSNKLGIDGSAQISGNAGISAAVTAQASGNAALVVGTSALASGNAALTSASLKLPLTGGVLTGDVTLNAQADVRFADSDSSNYIALQAPATVTSNVTFTIPSLDGTNGQVLGTNGAGVLSFITPAASGFNDIISEGNTSAEVIDTGSDGRFIVTTEGTERLRVDTAASTSTLPVVHPLGAVGTPSLTFTGDLNTGIYSPGADQVAVTTNGVARVTTSTTAVSSSLAIDVPLGAVGTPSLTFTGDLNTGIYSPAADTIAASTGGSERARIDSSGRLLVGTSTSSSYGGTASILQVEKSAGSDAAASIWYNNNDTIGSFLILGKSRGTTEASNTVVQNGDTLGTLVFFGADGTDRSPSAAFIRCQVDGTPGSNDMPGRLIFGTTSDGSDSPTERMRISSDGTVVVNATTTTYSPTSFAVRGIMENTIATYNNGDVFFRFLSGTQGSATLRGYIETNGISVFYSTASDARLKENIQNAQEAGVLLDSIKVRSFDWKESGIHQDFGFVAQELSQVYPEAVCNTTDEDRLLALDYSKLVPLLVKEIQSLRTRLAALESA